VQTPYESTAFWRVVSFVCGRPERDWHFTRFMIFSAFIDDSGSDRSSASKDFVLAGFLASAPVWIEFVKEWIAALDEDPAIEYFKLKEAVRRQDQFRPFTVDQRDARVIRMLDIIRKYKLNGIVHSISYDLFDDLLKGKMAPEFDNPYFGAFMDVTLGLAARRREFASKHDLQFFFDEQSTLGDVADLWYRRFRAILPAEDQSHLAPNVRFEDDKKFLPLQAADTLAWTVRRMLYDEGGGLDLPVNLLQEFRKGLPHVQKVTWTREKIVSLIETYNLIMTDVEGWKTKVSAGNNPLTELVEAGKITHVWLRDEE